eukprot:10083271-Lingulodinium_polyedra.AAC.1
MSQATISTTAMTMRLVSRQRTRQASWTFLRAQGPFRAATLWSWARTTRLGFLAEISNQDVEESQALAALA